MSRGLKHISAKTLRTYGKSRAVRHPDCDYSNNVDVHITLCAARGAPFRLDDVARMVCENVEHYCGQFGYRLYGYCLMPDHLHVLLSPSASGRPLSAWLNSFKSFTTNRFMKLGQKPPLWQRSAYDHVCRMAETAEVVLAYLAENPVRAGLVRDWREWEWTRVFIEL